MNNIRKFNLPFDKLTKEAQVWRSKISKFEKLIIEIGAGVGFHAIKYAKANNNSFFIAIEKTSEKFNKLNTRVLNHPNLDNIYPVHANAINWIYNNIYKQELDECFILYPNPYPKASQQNKRFTNIPFMDYLFSRLKIGGKLTLATNMKYYFEEAKEAFIVKGYLKLLDNSIINSIDNFSPRTHFEKKYLDRGEVCYNLVFIKVSEDGNNAYGL